MDGNAPKTFLAAFAARLGAGGGRGVEAGPAVDPEPTRVFRASAPVRNTLGRPGGASVSPARPCKCSGKRPVPSLSGKR